MYIIAVLCIVKIYQNRHPDVNAEAPTIFGVLSGTLLIVIFGILKGDVWFRVGFAFLHLVICLFLSMQIYYVGQWTLNTKMISRVVEV